MRLLIFVLLCLLCCLCEAVEDADFISKIRPDHPRLFLNAEILPLVKQNALGPVADHYQQVKATADRVLGHTDIQFHVYECTLPGLMMCFYVTGEQKYKDKALWILRKGSVHIGEMFKQKKAVSWFSFARIALMMGYDWLYQDLSAAERKQIGQRIIENVRLLNDPKSPKINRENYFGFPGGGFYGVRNLKWYAGLTFHKEGIADDLCVQWMKEGLADFAAVAQFRGKSGGDDGGMSAVVLGYVFGAYPRCEWNLIHTYRSAIGENIADRFSYLANITNWIVWRTINGGDGKLFGYGAGDTTHNQNATSYSNNHLAQIQYFYGDSHPRQSQLANYIRQINPKKDLGGFHFEELYAFLLDWEKMGKTRPDAFRPDATWSHARHFEFLGQFFMRSGFGADDTYCLFTAGNKGAGHGHFDELNFVIYKKGFLALDTGTRDQTGGTIGNAACVRHNTEYYNRTVAHNCLLIKMPGETFPHHWGNVPKRNDGGQNKQHGSIVRAFSTNQHYTYVNADASPVYSAQKATLVNRQFLYLPPNHFVIVDHVTSTQSDYAKTWLLHTQDKPELVDGILRTEHRQGVLFCKTLWPQDAHQELVGGPGKTAWVDGEDFPVTKSYRDGARKKHKGDEPFELLTGNWRLEVSPATAQDADVFVHVIEVGDAGELTAMHAAQLTVKGETFLIDVDLGDRRHAAISVSATDPNMGRIEIRNGKKSVVNEPFTRQVQAQNCVDGAFKE